jgi:hypothetical protein
MIVVVGLAGGTLRFDATEMTFWAQFGSNIMHSSSTWTWKFPRKARTGNFQVQERLWNQSERPFERETAKANPKNGNFRPYFHASIAVRRSYPPVAHCWARARQIVKIPNDNTNANTPTVFFILVLISFVLQCQLVDASCVVRDSRSL